MTKYKVWLLTPDYPPQLGGLSTFAITIENSLKKMGIAYELFVWDSIAKLRSLDVGPSDIVINIHFVGGYFLKEKKCRVINFIHGSEVLFYSPNLLKRLYKKIYKKRMIQYLESSYLNVFISEATRGLLEERGFDIDYGRDVILHNCLEFGDVPLVPVKNFDGPIKICSIVRDVPHKNLDGVVDFAEKLAKVSGKEIELFLTSKRRFTADGVKVVDISGIPDEHREQVYRDSHFNILLSLDHSRRGFIEGFGLTVLEAGKFGVPSLVAKSGGLSESVHHNLTGWIVEDVKRWWEALTYQEYAEVSKRCREHTLLSHDASLYQKLFLRLLSE